MKMVANYPKGILAPIGLLTIMVPVGVVTHNIWIDALSDRISIMVDLEPNPQEVPAGLTSLLSELSKSIT